MEREDTSQSPSGERERVLEASTNSWILEASANIFGGGTEKPPDASPAVDDGRRFFRSGGTKAAWNLWELMTGAGGMGPTCRRGLQPSELSRR
jgi:hypothetical protein